MMLPGKDRPAIGKMALAVLVIVVVVIGGAIGVSYPKAGQGAPAATSTSASTNSSSTPSSSVSSIATASSLTASAPLFNFVLGTQPVTIVLAPGANLTFATLSVIPLPSSHELAGQPLDVGAELVVLIATVPSGLHLVYLGSNLLNRAYVEVPVSSQKGVALNLVADKGVAPGDYTISIAGASGNYTTEFSFTVRVAQYLVIAYANAFSPANITVKVGSTVYWLNLGGNGAPENYVDVVFNTIQVKSPSLDGNRYESFSYTFATPGTYSYSSSLTASPMTGTITVTN